MRVTSGSVVAAMLLLFISSPARGDVFVSYTVPWSIGSGASSSTPVELPQFNPAMGTLDYATLDLSVATSQVIVGHWENMMEYSWSSPYESVALRLTGTGVDITGWRGDWFPSPFSFPPCSLGPYDGVLDWTGADSGTSTATLTGYWEYFPGSVMTPFTPWLGTGVVALTVNERIMQHEFGGMPIAEYFDYVGTTSGLLTVSYSYTIPEPSTLMLLLVGGVATFACIWRGRKPM
jgi:hypothetical protein